MRISNLEDLEELSALIVQLRGAGSREQGAGSTVQRFPAQGQVVSSAAPNTQASLSAPATAKKKFEPAAVAAAPMGGLQGDADDDDDAANDASFVLESHNAAETWRRAVEKVPGLVADQAKKFSRLEVSGINRLTIHFAPEEFDVQVGLSAARSGVAFRAGVAGRNGASDPDRFQNARGCSAGGRNSDDGPAARVAAPKADGSSGAPARQRRKRIVWRNAHGSGRRITTM